MVCGVHGNINGIYPVIRTSDRPCRRPILYKQIPGVVDHRQTDIRVHHPSLRPKVLGRRLRSCKPDDPVPSLPHAPSTRENAVAQRSRSHHQCMQVYVLISTDLRLCTADRVERSDKVLVWVVDRGQMWLCGVQQASCMHACPLLRPCAVRRE